MSDVRDLYQEVILDHNKSPHNFHKIEGADHSAQGYNPLCGDTVTVYVLMQGDVIKDIAFEGGGCAISKASASIMTTALKGKTQAQDQELFDKFHATVTAATDAAADNSQLGKLAVFAGVREYPARIKCATLAWHTLKEALMGTGKTVSTETQEKNADKPVDLKDRVVEAIRLCYDPEIPVNVYDMGLIYDVQVDSDARVSIRMTLTSPHCPMAGTLPMEVQRRVESVSGVHSAKVELVWDPPWTPARMSEAAKLELGMD